VHRHQAVPVGRGVGDYHVPADLGEEEVAVLDRGQLNQTLLQFGAVDTAGVMAMRPALTAVTPVLRPG